MSLWFVFHWIHETHAGSTGWLGVLGVTCALAIIGANKSHHLEKAPYTLLT